jgi:hypothetical protein
MSTKMSKAKWKTYHALTCGDKHPKYLIKGITNYWQWRMKEDGFNLRNSVRQAEVPIWLPPNKKHLWYFYSAESCMSFICLNYNKYLKNWYVVDQEKHDIEIHIGWDKDEHSPVLGFVNGYHNSGVDNDSVWYTRKNNNETGQEIAQSWMFFIDMKLADFSQKKLTDKYMEE